MKTISITSVFVASSLLITLFLCSLPDAQAQASKPEYRILFVGHLNFDCIQDTLIGKLQPTDSTRRSSIRNYLPFCIRWGAVTENSCPGGKKHLSKKYVDVTMFSYPQWRQIRSSCAIEKLNQDSVWDIMFTFSGRMTGTNGAVRDTSFTIGLLGQNSLREQENIEMKAVSGIKTSPFVAIGMKEGIGLEEAKKRSMGTRGSYILKRLSLNVSPDTMRTFIAMVTSVEKNTDALSLPPVLHIYPNPANRHLSIEGDLFEEGDYTVVITSLQGSVVLERSVRVDDSGVLLGTMPLEQLASGSYIAQIFSGGAFYGSYPFVIVH